MYNFFQNEKLVQEVLRAIIKSSIYVKLSKCQYNVSRI